MSETNELIIVGDKISMNGTIERIVKRTCNFYSQDMYVLDGPDVGDNSHHRRVIVIRNDGSAYYSAAGREICQFANGQIKRLPLNSDKFDGVA